MESSDGGGGRIRTFEVDDADLQSAPFGRSGTPPRGNAFTGLLPYREAGRIISNDAPL